MDIKIKVREKEEKLIQKAKEIIWNHKLSIASVVFQLFKKIVSEPDKVIRFLYLDS